MNTRMPSWWEDLWNNWPPDPILSFLFFVAKMEMITKLQNYKILLSASLWSLNPIMYAVCKEIDKAAW